jgi:hypothetical protein
LEFESLSLDCVRLVNCVLIYCSLHLFFFKYFSLKKVAFPQCGKNIFCTKWVVIVIAFWIHIQEVLSLNLCWNTSYLDRFFIVLLSIVP